MVKIGVTLPTPIDLIALRPYICMYLGKKCEYIFKTSLLGAYGLTCGKLVDNLCNTLPCENNGTCLGNQTHYKCECKPGYVCT